MKKGNLTNPATNKCGWNDTNTADDCPLNNPLISNRMFVNTYECNANHDMCKCQPISPIGNKWIFEPGFIDAIL